MPRLNLLQRAFTRDAIEGKMVGLTENWPVLLLGGPGTGKTTLAYLLGAQVGMTVYPFPCTPQSTAQDLIGGNQADPWGQQPLRWVPGPALVARGYGLPDPVTGVRPPPGILLINDAHEAIGSDAEGALYAVLENAPLLMPDGTLVEAPGSDMYRCVVTANGTIDQFKEAIRSRLGGHVPVNMPPTAALRKIEPPELAKLCWGDYKQHAGAPMLTYRHYLRMSELWKTTDLATAVMVACDADEDAAVGILQALADDGIREAGALLTGLSDDAPSGAPGA